MVTDMIQRGLMTHSEFLQILGPSHPAMVDLPPIAPIVWADPEDAIETAETEEEKVELLEWYNDHGAEWTQATTEMWNNLQVVDRGNVRLQDSVTGLKYSIQKKWRESRGEREGVESF